MIVYWTLFLAPAIGALSERERRGTGSLAGFSILLVFTFFLIAFREVGGDWYTYNILFNIISNLDFISAIKASDPAYGALNWASSQLGLGIYGVNAACAVIFLFAFWHFCSTESRPMLMLTVAMAYLIIVVVVGYTRQGTAIGLELLALRALMARQSFRFMGWLLFAAAFHSTAEILLPLVYFAAPKGGGKILRRALALGAAGILIGLTYRELSAKADIMLSIYVESSHYQSSGAVLRSMMNVVAALTFLGVRKRWTLVWGDADIWFAFSLAALGVLAMSFSASTAADRIGLYLIPLQIVVFGRLPSLVPLRGSQTAAQVVALYAIAFAVWLHLGQFAGDLWLPYKSLIFGEVG